MSVRYYQQLLNSADRMAIADVGTTGEPNRHVRIDMLSDYFTDLRSRLAANLPTLASNDRLFMSDEGTTGDPMRYTTLDTVTSYILDLDARIVTEQTTLADTDKFFFHDASADAMRYIEKADLESELGGGGTTYTAGTGISISSGAIGIANDGVTGTQIADDAINSEHIANNSVDLAHLASGTAGTFLGYNSSGNPAELAAPVADGFDLYDDFSTLLDTDLNDVDRMAIADVGTAGQPNRYVPLNTLGEYFADLRNHITTSNTTSLATGDRFFMSDENTAGDPMRYTSLNTLRNYFLDFDARFTTEQAAIADTDKIFYHDVSADAMRYIEKSDLESELGGYSEGTGISISAGNAISISNDGVTGIQIADNAINSEHIADNSVDLAHLASGTAGAYLGYNASGNPAELTAAAVDLYVDFSVPLPGAPVDADRMAIANISESGQPNRYVTIDTLSNHFADLRTHITTGITSLATTDRLFLTDESATGDPMAYATVSQLSDYLLDFNARFSTEQASLANTDKFFFYDASASSMRYVEASDLETAFGVDLYADFSTVLAGALAGADRLAIADVSEAGEPNRYARLDTLGAYFSDLTRPCLDRIFDDTSQHR